jgi:hypothetical protein
MASSLVRAVLVVAAAIVITFAIFSLIALTGAH